MVPRSRVPLYLIVACVVAGVASFGFLPVAYFLSGVAGVWLLGFVALTLPILAWGWWQDRGTVIVVDRLEIDESGIVYAYFNTDEERSVGWSEVSKVVFYHGEPDFPDPMVGMAPVKYWELTVQGIERSLEVPDSGKNSQRLVTWCARKLTGFDRSTAEEAVNSSLEGRWILWERRSGPA